MNLYRMENQDLHYYAEMNDHSMGGLSMMTNEKLVIGQLVYLEMENNDSPNTISGISNSYNGIVKWIRPYASTNGGTNGRYKYGVEFSETTH